MGTCTYTEAPSEGAATRRTWIVGAIHGIWAMIGTALGLPAAMYLLQVPEARRTEDWIEIGDIGRLPVGEPVQMAFHRNRVDSWRSVSEKLTAWVVRTPKSGVVAFGPRCTHLGCAHHWDSGRNHFVCPCHNSVFSIEGNVIAGPARRPLDQYDVKIEGNRLMVGSLRRHPENTA